MDDLSSWLAVFALCGLVALVVHLAWLILTEPPCDQGCEHAAEVHGLPSVLLGDREDSPRGD